LPSIKFTPKGETRKYSLREWFGDIQQVWHVFVCVSIFNWCQTKIKTTAVKLPYFYLKERFPDSFGTEIEGLDERFFAAKMTNEIFQDLMQRETDDIKHRIDTIFDE
jgi:hypothetical protein